MGSFMLAVLRSRGFLGGLPIQVKIPIKTLASRGALLRLTAIVIMGINTGVVGKAHTTKNPVPADNRHRAQDNQAFAQSPSQA
jgi:hypothetical protein